MPLLFRRTSALKASPRAPARMARPVRLGRAVMEGDRLRFEPDGDVLAADVGEEVDLVVEYACHEGSKRREEIVLVVRTEVDTVHAEASRVRLGDRPLLEDVAEGTVRHRAKFPWRGDVPLKITIEALWHETPWTGPGEIRNTTARFVEERVVRVR